MNAAQHTFLFCDLVGFTALTDIEGDERAATVGAALRRRVRELAAQYRAEVIKSMGDAAMVRCAEPGAGIHLALSLVDAVDADPALPPVRVGVNTGSAVDHDGDWYGRGVNVAARLCSVAAGGEVLVSEATLAAAGELSRLALGDRQLHWLKNVTEPVAARTAEVARRPGRVWKLMSHCRLRPDRRGQLSMGGTA